MIKSTISKFNQRPKTKIGWWAFWLSVISVLSGPILGISAAVIVPFISENASDSVGAVAGFGLMIAMGGDTNIYDCL